MNFLKFGSSKNFIIFLHGWGADLNSFLWLKDYFDDDYSLVFLDFNGFGKSCEPEKPFYVSNYVSLLKNLIDQFEVETLVLVGHSFGGRVAIKYAFSYQNLYKQFALVLVDSAGILPRRSFLYYFKIWLYKRYKKLSLTNYRFKNKLEKFGSDDYKKLSNVMKQTFINVVNEDLSSCAKFINCKTKIIWGNNDKETKLYMARKLNKFIKGSELYILKDAGHFSFLDKKEDFVIILDSFLKNL